MALTGVHFLLTYRCTQECDHCFVFSSPRAQAVFTGAQVAEVLEQSAALGSVEMVFFEGGEPFLYYPVLRSGVKRAASLGFSVGIVTNAYWAVSLEDAVLALEGLGIDLLSVSSDDLHHGGDPAALRRIDHALAAAGKLRIQTSIIQVERPGDVMFRGRAVDKLTPGLPCHPAASFRECPHERLDAPGRVHVDPFGFVHLCQGITIGNVFETPLREILAAYDPATHPVVGPLLRGGPSELARTVGFDSDGRFVDACHLCFLARRQARADGYRHSGLEPSVVYTGE